MDSPSLLPSPHCIYLTLSGEHKPSEESPLGAGNSSLVGTLRQLPCALAWERNRQSGLNHLQEDTMNLNRLNDRGSMNRDVFSSTWPSIGNCSIFSNTQSKSIFLKVPVTLSLFPQVMKPLQAILPSSPCEAQNAAPAFRAKWHLHDSIPSRRDNSRRGGCMTAEEL